MFWVVSRLSPAAEDRSRAEAASPSSWEAFLSSLVGKNGFQGAEGSSPVEKASLSSRMAEDVSLLVEGNFPVGMASLLSCMAEDMSLPVEGNSRVGMASLSSPEWADNSSRGVVVVDMVPEDCTRSHHCLECCTALQPAQRWRDWQRPARRAKLS